MPTTLRVVLLALTLATTSLSAATPEPTIEHIYRLARADDLAQAQALLDEVLRVHPNSPKAHFVQAQLDVQAGRLAAGREELARAEALKPGLPFARPAAVSRLRHALGDSQPQHNRLLAPGYSAGSHGLLFLLIGGAVAVLWLARRLFTPARPDYAATTFGGAPAASAGGLGASLAGGLATGAALGAGLVAGEALAHHFLDPDDDELLLEPHSEDDSSDPADYAGEDRDFGLADGASWDDAGDDEAQWD